MTKFREHRGSLAASMATLIEVASRAELVRKLRRDLAAYDFKVNDRDVDIHLYLDRRDFRIGWDKTYIVTIEGYGVAGFTDGPLS